MRASARARAHRAMDLSSNTFDESVYDRPIKTLLVGDSGVGKTCIFLRAVDDTFVRSYISTIGVDFKPYTVRLPSYPHVAFAVHLWDTAGQERFHAICASYYRGAEAIVLVYDVSDAASFEHVRAWCRSIRSQNAAVAIALLANKSDLRRHEWRVTRGEGHELAEELGADLFVETSAQTGANVREAFKGLVGVVARQREDAARARAHAQGGGEGARVRRLRGGAGGSALKLSAYEQWGPRRGDSLFSNCAC
jgi:small GTP-binding protein